MGIAKQSNEGLLLVILDENQYNHLYGLANPAWAGNKICYVCISRPCRDIVQELKMHKIGTGNFAFIDVLSSHYGAYEPVKNCTFLQSPTDLEAIKAAVIKSVREGGCRSVVLDAVSSLLEYNEAETILRFTNGLILGEKDALMLFVILKENGLLPKDIDTLARDLELFADKKIDMTEASRAADAG